MTIKDLVKKYKSDEDFRNKIGLYSGAGTSLVFALVQLYGGIRYQSTWFTAFAVYYIVLAVVKFYLARSVGKKGKSGWKVFRTAGLVMTVLNLALVVMISILIANPSIALHKYSAVITAVTAVWTLGSAALTVYDAIKTWKKNDPVALADRLVQLITATVSILILQTSLIASITTPEIETATSYIEEFGSIAMVPEEISGWFTDLFQKLATSNSITGVLVGVFSSGMTVYMIAKGTAEGKKQKKLKPHGSESS